MCGGGVDVWKGCGCVEGVWMCGGGVVVWRGYGGDVDTWKGYVEGCGVAHSSQMAHMHFVSRGSLEKHCYVMIL